MKTWLSFFVLCGMVSSIGCGNSADRPELAPVSGKVTFNNTPVAGATVSFWTENAARAASGTTDAEGKYRLTSFEIGDGAIPGEHTITIAKQDVAANVSSATADDPSAGYGEAMEAAAKGTTAKIAKDALPANYANQATSGLKRTVVKGENNTFDFEL